MCVFPPSTEISFCDNFLHRTMLLLIFLQQDAIARQKKDGESAKVILSFSSFRITIGIFPSFLSSFFVEERSLSSKHLHNNSLPSSQSHIQNHHDHKPKRKHDRSRIRVFSFCHLRNQLLHNHINHGSCRKTQQIRQSRYNKAGSQNR